MGLMYIETPCIKTQKFELGENENIWVESLLFILHLILGKHSFNISEHSFNHF